MDDDVADRLQAEVRQSGRPFKIVVNDHLRDSLTRRKAQSKLPPFRVEPLHLGGAVGGSYDDIGALLDAGEGTRHG